MTEDLEDLDDDNPALVAAYGTGSRHAAALADVLAAICTDMRRHIGTDLEGVVLDAIDDSLADELAERGVCVYPELDVALGKLLVQLGSQDDAIATDLDDRLDP